MDDVGLFLVECYRPDLDAEALDREGHRVVGPWSSGVFCLESIVVPGDGALLLMVAGGSATLTAAAALASGVPFDRISEATRLTPANPSSRSKHREPPDSTADRSP